MQLFRRKPRGDRADPGRRGARRRGARDPRPGRATPSPQARRTARGEAGRIGLGFTSSASFHPFVPRAIRAFRDAHPLVVAEPRRKRHGRTGRPRCAASSSTPPLSARRSAPAGRSDRPLRCSTRRWSRRCRSATSWPEPATAARTDRARRRDLHPLSPAGRARAARLRSSPPATAPGSARRSARRRRACCRP